MQQLYHELEQRLLSRLEYIKLQPTTILVIGNERHFVKVLKKRYPRAKFILLHDERMVVPRFNWFNRTRYLCASIESLPLADNSIDLIISNWALQTIDWPSAVKKLHDSLKPEGLLMFSVPGPDTYKELGGCWQQIGMSEDKPQFVDMHDIGDCLLGSHFSDPVMDMEIVTMHYQRIEQMLGDLQLENANSAEIAKLLNKNCTADGEYPLTFEVVYGHAWKAMPKPTRGIDANGVVQIPITSIR